MLASKIFDGSRHMTISLNKVKRRVVCCFGRFQPPTTGHSYLIRYLLFLAKRQNATPIVFASPTWDMRNNPIPFALKVGFLRRLFPRVVISNNERIRTPFDALAVLSFMGYDAVTMVVGSDETESFKKIAKYVKPKGIQDGKSIIFKSFQVVTVPGVRNEHLAGVVGISGSKLRNTARHGEYEIFARGIPSRDRRVVRQIYDSVRGVEE